MSDENDYDRGPLQLFSDKFMWRFGPLMAISILFAQSGYWFLGLIFLLWGMAVLGNTLIEARRRYRDDGLQI